MGTGTKEDESGTERFGMLVSIMSRLHTRSETHVPFISLNFK
jgi:hypothetical protein